jgi:hypothetical protein
MRVLSSFILTALLGALALPALADTDIDVVYGDDLAKRGELAAELDARCGRPWANWPTASATMSISASSCR